MSSKAYDSYLHLRSGYIVPWIDAISLNINTTHDLTMNPIDLLINPFCFEDKENCFASGSLVNDDGYQLNTTGNLNNYTFNYLQDFGATSL
jgi:hypothetical protein